MPIYEYACGSCGHRFDRLQGMSEPDPDACPVCKKPTVRRLISLSSFRLKGSGWYVTDYKGKNPTSSASSSAGADSASSDSGGAHDTSKPKSDSAAA